MKPRFVRSLCCPECRANLQLVPEGIVERQGEVEEGTLRCKNGHTYPVRAGIPRFVSSDAYVKSFSFEWMAHATTQLDSDRQKWSKDSFALLTGWSAQDLRGRRVLDVGCGMGRYADVVERAGGEVVGVDMSFAVDSAYRNIGTRPHVHLIQADIFRLPFKDKQFDAVYSLGVLHHTKETRAAFSVLPGLLKRGGTIAIWVYARYMGQRWHDALRIHVTSRVPQRILHALCFVLAQAPVYWLYRIPILRQFLQLAFWYPADGPFYRNWRWRWLDLFDFYSPTYAHRHTYPEVFSWFRSAGLQQIEILSTPVAVHGKRP